MWKSKIIKGINLEINKGEKISIFGESVPVRQLFRPFARSL